MEQDVQTGQDPLEQTEQYTVWRLIKIYWQSEQKKIAYLFAITILIMTIGLVGFDVVFNYWYSYFYNALQEYNKSETLKLLAVFFGLAFFYIILAVYRYYVTQLFALRWRRWLTDKFLDHWLAHRGYYYLEHFDNRTDNPDQRIQEDVGMLVTNSIDLTTGLIGAVTSFFAFIYVLWTLSGDLAIPLGSLGTLHIPGYLVWVSLIYASIGTWVTFKVGYPLIGLNFEQQRREATFRLAAIDLRRHSESIALYRGENHQRSILGFSFKRVLENWYNIIIRQKLLLWFTAGYGQLSVVLPLAVALPNYFGKVFKLGGLIQSLKAFTNVQDALSYLINSYNQIAQWRAICQRLITFLNHLHEVEHQVKTADHLQVKEQTVNQLQVRDLMIHKPDNALLLQNIHADFQGGNDYLIKGESGVGKSTFIRALAGIWPYSAGKITKPANKQFMFLPQTPYMPTGTLADAILFPNGESDHPGVDLPAILTQCHLSHLIPRLQENVTWSEQLSPGERQRIAFARVLVHKPDWIFLDESTSMLDVTNEKAMYELLKTHLPNSTIVSVGHRPTLEGFHSHVLDMMQFAAKSA